MRMRIVLSSLFALLLAACATPGGGGRYYDDGYGYARCQSCGTVERIDRVYGERRASGAGAVIGAIVGGALGNQVGSGSGRKAATAAGAIAGGVAGHNIEKNQRAAPFYELFVRMDDGRRVVVTQRELNGIREGSRVRVSGDYARLI